MVNLIFDGLRKCVQNFKSHKQELAWTVKAYRRLEASDKSHNWVFVNWKLFVESHQFYIITAELSKYIIYCYYVVMWIIICSKQRLRIINSIFFLQKRLTIVCQTCWRTKKANLWGDSYCSYLFVNISHYYVVV